MIEVEARTVLSRQQRDDMLAYMRTLGPLHEIDRVMMDFSGHDRTRTVMLRVNNGVQELVAKTGALADDVRHEASLKFAPESTFGEALSYLNIMGYSQALVFLRKMFVVTSGVEYSLRDILAPDTKLRMSTLLEIEARSVQAGQEAAAREQVHKVLVTHNLTALDKPGWEHWVADTHRQSSILFEYSPENAAALAESLTKSGFLKTVIGI